MFLVTGANGFVGQALGTLLRLQGLAWRPVLRRPEPTLPDALIMDIGPDSDWAPHLNGVRCVVHLAARVHILNDDDTDPLAAYRRMNVEATLRLARQAAQAGVARFIYLSSIKVNGEATSGHPFTNQDTPYPSDPYGVSKWEAEQGLARIAATTGLQVVVIRPPLVYGPHVKANFLQLMRLVRRGWPLPLAGVNNRRSMVYLGNLLDLILLCAQHPAAAGKTFLVSDGTDVSTSQLIRSIAKAMHRRALLFACPAPFLLTIASLLRRAPAAERLLGSLQVDIAATCNTLAWHPPVSFDAGIAATVDAFQRSGST